MAEIRQKEDVIFCICPDGSLVLWRVSHLDETPRRIPRIALASRTPKITGSQGPPSVVLNALAWSGQPEDVSWEHTHTFIR